MADNYLERHREEYEQRKQAWLKKKKHIPKAKQKASENGPTTRHFKKAPLSSPEGDTIPFPHCRGRLLCLPVLLFGDS